MEKDIRKQYTQMADGYDKTIPQLVPRYNRSIKQMVDFLPFERNQAIDVLDIGTGTGNLAFLVKKRFFHAQVTCLDTTPKMLEIAQKKLSGFSGLQYAHSRVEDFRFKKCQYDAVFVSMVFQNLENQRQKMRIYQKIGQSLKAQGVFVMFGPVKAPNVWLEEYYMKKWGRYLRRSFPEDKAEGELLARYHAKDGPVCFLDELAMLQKSGFQYVDVLHKEDNFATFVAMNSNDQ